MIRRFRPEALPKDPNWKFDWTLLKSDFLALEIGAGNGEHAISYASRHPNRDLIALERTTNKFKAFKKRLSCLETPLLNLYALQADALHWSAQNLSKGPPLSEILILYPNPYPKDRHANLRFANMPFMGFLLDHLKPQGQVVLTTNREFYYLEAREKLQNLWKLRLVEDTLLKADFTPRTAFEKKYLERGEHCWQIVLKKCNNSVSK